MKIKNSPYNLWETFGYFKRNYLGPVSKNRALVEYAPTSFELNPGIKPSVRIGFIGDIMDMAGRDLCMGDAVKAFFRGCDFLVGNFEATITTAKGAIMAQRHKPQILDALADLFDPEKTFLGMANNHSGDFGYKIWSESKRQVEDRGFRVFGTTETPFIDFGDNIRVTGCTWWTNQPCDYIVLSDSVTEYIDSDRFNILYPHWGYELELFPRPVTVKAGRQWLQQFNAVIGHHSHIPQPISIAAGGNQTGEANQLVAYGLGDFCIWEKIAHYLFGQVLKIEVGVAENGNHQIGQVDWQYTTCRQKSDSLWETNITDRFSYLNIDKTVKGPKIVTPDLIRGPDVLNMTGFRFSPE